MCACVWVGDVLICWQRTQHFPRTRSRTHTHTHVAVHKRRVVVVSHATRTSTCAFVSARGCAHIRMIYARALVRPHIGRERSCSVSIKHIRARTVIFPSVVVADDAVVPHIEHTTHSVALMCRTGCFSQNARTAATRVGNKRIAPTHEGACVLFGGVECVSLSCRVVRV